MPSNLRFRRAAKRLDEFIYQMIAERHSRPTDQPDLLSVLVRLSSESRKGMTDQKVRDQILTFFVAGHETTATALTWVWYLLAQHPAVMDKAQAELDGVLADRQLSVSDLERLPYTRMVFAEAMRLPHDVDRSAPIPREPRGGYLAKLTLRSTSSAVRTLGTMIPSAPTELSVSAGRSRGKMGRAGFRARRGRPRTSK